MASIKRQDLKKYTIALIMLILTSLTRFNAQLLPVVMSVYIALIKCNFSFAIISPLYITACLFNGFSVVNIIYFSMPIVAFFIIKLICKKLNKQLKIYCYIIVQVVIYLIIAIVDKNIIFTAISAIIAAILTYIFNIIFYAFFERKNCFYLSADEKACANVLLMCLGYGLFSINIINVRIFYLFFGFFIIYSLYKLKGSIALSCITSTSLGAAFYSQDIAIVGVFLIIYSISKIFKKLNKYITAATLMISLFACQMYFNALLNFNYFDFVAFIIGVFIYVALPKKIQNKLIEINFSNNSKSAQNLIKREKLELIKKLNTTESVIYEMAEEYIPKNTFVKREDVIYKLTKDVSMQTCSGCEFKENCYKSLNISPEIALRDLIDNALITKSITKEDMPVSINSRCKYVPKMLSIVNSVVNQYISKIENQKQLDSENRFFSMQMAGIGSILGSITAQIKEFPYIDDSLEEQLKAELGYNDIFCREALFMSSKDKNVVILVVWQKDKDNKLIAEIASKLLNDKLVKKDEEIVVDENTACVFLESMPKYDIAFSNIVVSKNGSTFCGDSQTIIKIKDNKVLLVLCDGMGTGEAAQKTSQKTLTLVQDFYKAGLDNAKSLLLINKALSCINKESFTAVDMCVADLNYGNVDFIKLGAMPSFIKRKEGIKIIESGALPLGILDTARPNVSREILTVNDLAVLVSDGIVDVLKREGISEILSRLNTSNPKIICDEIIGQAKIIGLNDDASVIAFKIYQKA